MVVTPAIEITLVLFRGNSSEDWLAGSGPKKTKWFTGLKHPGRRLVPPPGIELGSIV